MALAMTHRDETVKVKGEQTPDFQTGRKDMTRTRSDGDVGNGEMGEAALTARDFFWHWLGLWGGFRQFRHTPRGGATGPARAAASAPSPLPPSGVGCWSGWVNTCPPLPRELVLGNICRFTGVCESS